MRFLVLVACLLLAACGGSVDPTAATGEATAPVVADDAGDVAPAPVTVNASSPLAAVVDAGPLPLEVFSVSPASISGAGDELVTLHGSGFTAVVDVEVEITSIPFTVVDDATITFTMPAVTNGDATAQIDVYVSQADMTSATVQVSP